MQLCLEDKGELWAFTRNSFKRAKLGVKYVLVVEDTALLPIEKEVWREIKDAHVVLVGPGKYSAPIFIPHDPVVRKRIFDIYDTNSMMSPLKKMTQFSPQCIRMCMEISHPMGKLMVGEDLRVICTKLKTPDDLLSHMMVCHIVKDHVTIKNQLTSQFRTVLINQHEFKKNSFKLLARAMELGYYVFPRQNGVRLCIQLKKASVNCFHSVCGYTNPIHWKKTPPKIQLEYGKTHSLMVSQNIQNSVKLSQLNPLQRDAVKHVLRTPSGLNIIEGVAGTGKSTIKKHIMTGLDSKNLFFRSLSYQHSMKQTSFDETFHSAFGIKGEWLSEIMQYFIDCVPAELLVGVTDPANKNDIIKRMVPNIFIIEECYKVPDKLFASVCGANAKVLK